MLSFYCDLFYEVGKDTTLSDFYRLTTMISNEKMSVEGTKLVIKHKELVRSAAAKYLGNYYADWVDDITQDVMVKVLTNFRKYDSSKGSLESWVYTMTRNMCYDFMAKKVNALNNIVIDEGLVLYCDEEISIEYKDVKKMIRSGLDNLSERDRTMLIMRYYFNCSGREMAELMGVPENQIAPRLLRAKARLKNRLDNGL